MKEISPLYRVISVFVTEIHASASANPQILLLWANTEE